MRLSKRRQSDRVRAVEITPMIDVVFLLIIFFMTTAQFARMTRAELDLPQEPGEQQAAEEAGIVVNVLRDGQIIVNDREVTLQQMLAMVQDKADREGGSHGIKLLLRADRDGSTARLNEVVTQLQQLGVFTARVATEVP